PGLIRPGERVWVDHRRRAVDALGLETGDRVRPRPFAVQQVDIPAAGPYPLDRHRVQSVSVSHHGRGAGLRRDDLYGHLPDPWRPHAEAHGPVGTERGPSLQLPCHVTLVLPEVCSASPWVERLVVSNRDRPWCEVTLDERVNQVT